MSEGEMPPRRLNGIQYLRAIAALAVLGQHSIGSRDFPFVILASGVDLFFVLSGFLMVAITDEHSRPLDFFRRRFLRVVPLYWIVTACAVAALWSGLLWQSGLDRWHVAASFLFIPAQHPSADALLPVVQAGWTLNYEMFFYSLFALLLLLPRRFQVPALTAILLTLAILGSLLRPESAALRGWTSPIALEFAAGAWVGIAWQRGRSLWLPVLASVPVIAATVLLFPPAALIDWRVVVTPAVLALLAGTLALERRGTGIRDIPLLRHLGDASYSIYLWQWFAVAIGWTLHASYGLPREAVGFFIFPAGLIGGVIAYHLIERPLLALIGQRRRWRDGVPIPGGL